MEKIVYCNKCKYPDSFCKCPKKGLKICENCDSYMEWVGDYYWCPICFKKE